MNPARLTASGGTAWVPFLLLGPPWVLLIDQQTLIFDAEVLFTFLRLLNLGISFVLNSSVKILISSSVA